MTFQERSPFGVAVYLEHRAHGHGSVSTIPHTNGTVMASGHPGFIGTATQLIITDLEAAG